MTKEELIQLRTGICKLHRFLETSFGRQTKYETLKHVEIVSFHVSCLLNALYGEHMPKQEKAQEISESALETMELEELDVIKPKPALAVPEDLLRMFR